MSKQSKEKTVPDIMMNIASSYLVNNCENCPFYYISKTCDSIPLNCTWLALHAHFSNCVSSSEQTEVNNENS